MGEIWLVGFTAPQQSHHALQKFQIILKMNQEHHHSNTFLGYRNPPKAF